MYKTEPDLKKAVIQVYMLLYSYGCLACFASICRCKMHIDIDAFDFRKRTRQGASYASQFVDAKHKKSNFFLPAPPSGLLPRVAFVLISSDCLPSQLLLANRKGGCAAVRFPASPYTVQIRVLEEVRPDDMLCSDDLAEIIERMGRW
jgi:hypothetical protein